MGLYSFKEVGVRLCLKETGAWFSEQPVSDPQAAVRLMGEVLKEVDREMVCAVNLDIKNRPINYSVISVGAIDRSLVPVQNIFKPAILSNAAGIILLHNHPSGDVTPSISDIELTNKVVSAGRLMDMPVRDHVIVAGITGQFYSFAEHMPDIFSRAQQEERRLPVKERGAGPAQRDVTEDADRTRRRNREWERE